MFIKYVIIIFASIFLVNVTAAEIKITSIGKDTKNIFYTTVSTQTSKPQFPALYLYDVTKQQFLSKQDAETYLSTLDNHPLWSEVMLQWVKDSSQFSTNNEALNQAIPQLVLDRQFVIFYDNLPPLMQDQFKMMDPNLLERDQKVKHNLSQLDNARIYTTY